MKKLTEYVSGNFLKAINVTSENDAYIIIMAKEVKENEQEQEKVRLTLEKDDISYEFDLNRTNITFLINAGYVDPLTLVGKKIYFKKALVRNPKTNQEVEGLRIKRIE